MDLKNQIHKQGVNPDDWSRCSSNLRVLAYEFVEYCKSRNLPCVFSSIIRPMIAGVSKTDIHSKGRAFDCSARGWTMDQLRECENYFNELYSNIGAISISDGKARACVVHDSGAGLHFHFQVRSFV